MVFAVCVGVFMVCKSILDVFGGLPKFVSFLFDVYVTMCCFVLCVF